jgi:Reverse transcriptase (RNA-dependent DNA polymerase)
VRLVIILVLMHGWETVQIDFIISYTQADVECDLYMRIPKGFTIKEGTRETHVIKLWKNLYGQKQAGRVWNQHLNKSLIKLGWTQSSVDDCLYYKGCVMFVVYVDDGILISPFKKHIENELKVLQQVFNISVEGDINDYVGVKIERTSEGTIRMTQLQLINSILKELNFKSNTKPSHTPVFSTTVLKDGMGKAKHNADWSYCRITGKLNFIAASCRPELSCAVHQCARFSHDPRVNHTKAVKRIARYLVDSTHQGIKFKPTEHSFRVWADEDYGGLYDRETAADSPVTAKSLPYYVGVAASDRDSVIYHGGGIYCIEDCSAAYNTAHTTY